MRERFGNDIKYYAGSVAAFKKTHYNNMQISDKIIRGNSNLT